jgi:hypothetical protein
MNLIAATGQYPTQFRHFIDVNRRALFNSVFGLFAFNMYTGGWGLSADPTYIDDLYDSQFIRPFLTNYPNYNDALFNGFARGLRAAQQGPPSDFFANARALAFAAEQEFNDTVAIVDIWTDTGGLAYRIYHTDADSVLNGLKWEGLQIQTGVGPYGQWSWFNAHLVGAPLHDPAHPVFMKWGWKTDLLDSPNPIDSSFLWDGFANGLEFDALNIKVADDAGFTGDLPQMASLPALQVITPVGGVCTFPNGETSGFDVPGNVCSVLSYQLRPDLTFAASLDGKIPAYPVTAGDVRFSIFDGKNSPTSFLTPGYVHVQDVVITSMTSFDVYERNAAVWNRHDIGGTPIVSAQHWCVEAHDAWTGATPDNCLANPGTTGFVSTTTTGWPDAGVNTLSSSSGHQLPGPAVGVDLGSYAFVYDSEVSFPGNSPNGPVLYRLRQTPGLALPAGTPTCQPTGTGCGYASVAPGDAYFTNDLGAKQKTPGNCGPAAGGCSFVLPWWFFFAGRGDTIAATVVTGPCAVAPTAASCTFVTETTNPPPGVVTQLGSYGNPGSTMFFKGFAKFTVSTNALNNVAIDPIVNIGGWLKFHLAGNINWYCTATTAQPCSAGITSENGPLPSPDSVINIVDLAIVAVHFGETPGTAANPCASVVGGCPFGAQPWDINGPSGSPDGKVDIFDLGRVAVHFGQSFWGGTDLGGGAVGTLPGWAYES